MDNRSLGLVRSFSGPRVVGFQNSREVKLIPTPGTSKKFLPHGRPISGHYLRANLQVREIECLRPTSTRSCVPSADLPRAQTLGGQRDETRGSSRRTSRRTCGTSRYVPHRCAPRSRHSLRWQGVRKSRPTRLRRFALRGFRTSSWFCLTVHLSVILAL